jgi:hypothetical protein
MKMLTKFFNHGAEDVAALIDHLPKIDDEHWYRWDFRLLPSLARSEPTIPFFYMKNFTPPHLYVEIKAFKQPAELEALVLPLGRKMEEKFRGRCLKLMLVMIEPNQEPHFHTDPSDTLLKAHRLHMPLVQSDETRYHVGGEEFAMEAGHWYEKSNDLVHAVINRASPRQRRYSLQCDIYPEDESRFERFPGLYPKE